jgi:transcriptional regulator with XRE-family HTH domain
MTSKTVQSLLIEHRKQKKLSQKKMADKLNVSRRVYQRIELGEGTIMETYNAFTELGLKIMIVPDSLIKEVFKNH